MKKITWFCKFCFTTLHFNKSLQMFYLNITISSACKFDFFFFFNDLKTYISFTSASHSSGSLPRYISTVPR